MSILLLAGCIRCVTEHLADLLHTWNRQALYTFTVYPSKSYFAFVLERFSEFCSGLSHIEGLAGLHTLMPIPPQAIEKAGTNNPLGLHRAEANTSLSGEPIYSSIRFNGITDNMC